MAKEIEAAPATVTLQFTLEEARYIVRLAAEQAEATENWFIVNSLDALTRFVRQNDVSTRFCQKESR